MARIKVGDTVKVLSGPHEGKSGVVTHDDGSDNTAYRIDSVSPGYWFGGTDGKLELISEHDSSASSGKPVDHFEVGTWYKWVGPIDFNINWSCLMNEWKDGNPRKCTCCDGRSTFDNIGGGNWDYRHCMQYFREVTDPTMHDSVCGLPHIGKLISDKIVGEVQDFNPASVKTRSQRRAEILHGLTID